MNPNFIEDADQEERVGISPARVDFVIRMNKEELPEANLVVKEFVEDRDDNALLRLVADESKLLSRLDEEGSHLVIHEVARCIKPDSPELDLFLKHRPLSLLLQNSKLNCALHYLAYNGVDLLGRIPLRYLMVRNKNKCTPLHLMARNPDLRERVLALPSSMLEMKTKLGVSVQDAANYVEHEDVNQIEARSALESSSFNNDLSTYPSKIMVDGIELSMIHKMDNPTCLQFSAEKETGCMKGWIVNVRESVFRDGAFRVSFKIPYASHYKENVVWMAKDVDELEQRFKQDLKSVVAKAKKHDASVVTSRAGLESQHLEFDTFPKTLEVKTAFGDVRFVEQRSSNAKYLVGRIKGQHEIVCRITVLTDRFMVSALDETNGNHEKSKFVQFSEAGKVSNLATMIRCLLDTMIEVLEKPTWRSDNLESIKRELDRTCSTLKIDAVFKHFSGSHKSHALVYEYKSINIRISFFTSGTLLVIELSARNWLHHDIREAAQQSTIRGEDLTDLRVRAIITNMFVKTIKVLDGLLP